LKNSGLEVEPRPAKIGADASKTKGTLYRITHGTGNEATL
jgi:hypothetical protein